MFKEFKEFAVRGNVVDMAVGIVIGGAFGIIVKSLVSDIIMPPIGLLFGKVEFSNLFILLKEGTVGGPYSTLVDAQKAGAITINYGILINTIISFLIVAFAIFYLIRTINKLKKQEAEQAPVQTKECPHCFSSIHVKATRCSYCTSELKLS